MAKFNLPNSTPINNDTVGGQRREKEELKYEKSVEVEQKTKQIGLERSAAEQILMEMIPGVDQARKLLTEIGQEDVAEITSFTTAPEAIQVYGLSLSSVPLYTRNNDDVCLN